MINNSMKRILVYVGWLGSACCLIAAGIGCLLNRADAIENLAGWISIVILIAGLLQWGVAFLIREQPLGNHRFSSKATMLIALGITMLLKNVVAAEVIRIMTSMVMLFGGLAMLDAAGELRKEPLPLKNWLWLVGGLEACLGFLGFLKFVMSGVTFGVAIGLSLMCEAVIPFFLWLMEYLCVRDEKMAKQGPRPGPEPAPAPAPEEPEYKPSEPLMPPIDHKEP